MSVGYNDVRTKIMELSEARGLDTSRQLLAKYGVAKATELREDQWKAIIHDADDLIRFEDRLARFNDSIYPLPADPSLTVMRAVQIEQAAKRIAETKLFFSVYTIPSQLWVTWILLPLVLFSAISLALAAFICVLWQSLVRGQVVKVGSA